MATEQRPFGVLLRRWRTGRRMTQADLAERGAIVGAHDLIIAATALAHGAPVMTLNDKEFRRVKGLDVRAVRVRESS